MRVTTDYCDICDKACNNPSVVQVKWANTRKDYDYFICDECRGEILKAVPRPIEGSVDQNFFKAMLSVCNKKQQEK